jgi:hypothetical protein
VCSLRAKGKKKEELPCSFFRGKTQARVPLLPSKRDVRTRGNFYSRYRGNRKNEGIFNSPNLPFNSTRAKEEEKKRKGKGKKYD